MTGFLLDSDIAIELLRGRNLQLAGKLASFSHEKVFLSTITLSDFSVFPVYKLKTGLKSNDTAPISCIRS